MDHVRGEKHAAFKGNELLKPLKDHFSLYYAERVYNDWAQGSSLREDSQQNLCSFGWCFVDRIQTVHHNQMHRHVRRVNLQLQAIELPHSEERKLFPLSVFSLASTVSCESTKTHRRRTMLLNMHVFEKRSTLNKEKDRACRTGSWDSLQRNSQKYTLKEMDLDCLYKTCKEPLTGLMQRKFSFSEPVLP